MLIYFRWCQSFHYKPHFSEVYNLVIKMLQGPRPGRCKHSCLGPFQVSRGDVSRHGREQKAGVRGLHISV